jgi:hypothetical protein
MTSRPAFNDVSAIASGEKDRPQNDPVAELNDPPAMLKEPSEGTIDAVNGNCPHN